MKKEVFDLLKESVAHVIQQGGPSVIMRNDRFRYKSSPKTSSCLYRAPNGRQCAAGIFIKEYDPDMESRGWPALSGDDGIPKSALDARARRHCALVGTMQAWHDKATGPRLEMMYPQPRQADDAFMKSYISNVRHGVSGVYPGLSPTPEQSRELEALLMSYRGPQE